MSFNLLIERIGLGIIYIGMPFVHYYHTACDSIFINTAADQARGFERAGNYALAPVHYLFGGTIAIEVDPKEHFYYLKQRFEYHERFALKTAAALVALPVGLVAGSILKGISYFSEDTRARHQAIADSRLSTRVDSNNDYYRSIGIDIEDFEEAALIGPPHYVRKLGEENHLSIEKKALSEIARILQKNKIPFWVDCGTCLGAYRYGGVIPWDNDVDIAILEPDHENVKHALNALDPEKYTLQDWSGRERPGTYLKVYLKENRALIDIYHFRVDRERKTLHFVLSNEGSIFLPEFWKVRERRYVVTTPFEQVFPLKKAELDGVLIPVPSETKQYLQDRFGENIDPVKIYNAATCRYEKDETHPYWKLEFAR